MTVGTPKILKLVEFDKDQNNHPVVFEYSTLLSLDPHDFHQQHFLMQNAEAPHSSTWDSYILTLSHPSFDQDQCRSPLYKDTLVSNSDEIFRRPPLYDALIELSATGCVFVGRKILVSRRIPGKGRRVEMSPTNRFHPAFAKAVEPAFEELAILLGASQGSPIKIQMSGYRPGIGRTGATPHTVGLAADITGVQVGETLVRIRDDARKSRLIIANFAREHPEITPENKDELIDALLQELASDKNKCYVACAFILLARRAPILFYKKMKQMISPWNTIRVGSRLDRVVAQYMAQLLPLTVWDAKKFPREVAGHQDHIHAAHFDLESVCQDG